MATPKHRRAAVASPAADLTTDEQEHVRVALKHLHAIYRQWKLLGPMLRIKAQSVKNIAHGYGCVSASIAFRVARLAGVPMEDLLRGCYPPPGTCKHCGRSNDG